MIRRLALAATAALAVAAALPASAAPKAELLYLGNVGQPANNACTQSLQLLRQPTPNAECTGNIVAVQNSGYVGDETYTTGKSTALKLDVGRPITGTVYVVSLPAISGGPFDSLPYLPGYVNAVATVKVDATKVGTFNISGPIPPVTGLKTDFSLKLPASLKNVTAKKVTVTIDFIDAVGLVGVSYTDPTASKMSIPLR